MKLFLLSAVLVGLFTSCAPGLLYNDCGHGSQFGCLQMRPDYGASSWRNWLMR